MNIWSCFCSCGVCGKPVYRAYYLCDYCLREVAQARRREQSQTDGLSRAAFTYTPATASLLRLLHRGKVTAFELFLKTLLRVDLCLPPDTKISVTTAPSLRQPIWPLQSWLEKLAAEFCAQKGWQYWPRLLHKTRRQRQRAQSSRCARIHAPNFIAPTKKEIPAGQLIILDDIQTTGTTMRQCLQAAEGQERIVSGLVLLRNR